MSSLRGVLFTVGLFFSALKGLCAWTSQPQGRLLYGDIGGFKPLTESHRVASSLKLDSVLGGLATHFAKRGVTVAESASFLRDERSLEVLLLLFHDSRKAKDYYLFWRAAEMLSGPVRDLEVSMANACTFSIVSGRWALLVGRALAFIQPKRREDTVPQEFLEGLAKALMEPTRPQPVEIKLSLKRRGRRRFVTLRDFAKSIKAPLSYDQDKGEALLKIGMFSLAFKPGRREVVTGGASLTLPSPPVLIEGRIYLTPEALEALTGAKVEVDEKEGLVKLLFPAIGPPPFEGGPPEGERKAQEYTALKGASEGVEGRGP